MNDTTAAMGNRLIFLAFVVTDCHYAPQKTKGICLLHNRLATIRIP